MQPKCPKCAREDRVVQKATHFSCSRCQTTFFSLGGTDPFLRVWDALGKIEKLGLSQRNPHIIQRVLKDPRGEWRYDRDLIDKVLARADKYASDLRGRR